MCLYYENQVPVVLIGSKTGTTRTSATLTNAYDDADTTKAFATGGFSKLNLSILYTMGATETSNSIEVRLRESNDGTNYYRIPNDSTSGGTSTITPREFTYVGTNAAAASISIPLDIFYKNMDISIKETGVASNAGTVYCEALLSGE